MKEIYTAFAPHNDITFIMEDTYDESGEIVTTECVGWYYGEPNDEATQTFIGKVKATY